MKKIYKRDRESALNTFADNHNKVLSDDRDVFWMKHAIQLAKKAKSLEEVPVGAVVVMDDNVIGEGWNQPITSNDATAHAEIIAIRAAGFELENYRIPKATLYITIEPCAMCLGAIIHSRICKVVFGAMEPKAGMLKSHKSLLGSGVFNHAFDFEGGVCEAECSQLMSDFFSERRALKKAKKIK